ncbi:MAG: helix-turn-helix domain-containing protein [Dehalococcoidia bacterium]
MPDEAYVTVAEASRRTGLSRRQLTRLLQTGVIDGIKPGRDWLVRLSAVTTYLKEERKPGPKRRVGN